MYYIIKIRISLNYADVNSTMNSLCKETVKRYICSVVINLSASLLSTKAAQDCAKVRENIYRESCCKLLGLLETKCVKGEVQLVSEGKLPATLSPYASTFDVPNDRPVLDTSPQKADDRYFVPLAIFYSGRGQQNKLKKEIRNLIHFLRTEEITSTVWQLSVD